MHYTYVIIEDEKGAYENLKEAVNCKKGYSFQGFATNVKDGLNIIVQNNPDLVFLDCELGKENGFTLIQELKKAFYQIPPIIMTTAYGKYAQEAVNNQITYFLNKPINLIELSKALLIFEKQLIQKKSQLFIRHGSTLSLVQYDEILYLKADKGYTYIYKTDGKKESIPKSLKYLQSQFNQDFVRVHRSYMVNLNKIKEIKLTEKTILIQNNGENHTIEIGNNYIKKLRNQLHI